MILFVKIPPIIDIHTGKQLLNRLLFCQVNGGSQDLEPIVAHLPSSGWSQWIAAHGLSSLFLYACRDKEIIPGSVLSQWETLQIQLLFQNIGFLKIAATLFTDLEDAGIQAVAMRGLTLLNKIYQEPCMRPMGDIDILINQADCDSVRSVLDDKNYALKAVYRSQYVYSIADRDMEIHWSFITAKRYRKRMDTSRFIATRQPLELKEGRIFCLKEENELIGLVAHAVIHHELTILRQLFDIAFYLCMPDMDWDYISTWCRKAQMTRMFVFTIHLTGILFDIDVSIILKHFHVQISRSRDKIVQNYVESFFTVHISQLLARKRNVIYMAEGPWKKMEQLLTLFSMTEAKDIYKRYFESETPRQNN